MIKQTLGYVGLCGWLVAAAGSLQAHHALASAYDMEGDQEKAGTVSSVKFTNPHGSLSVAVKNADGTTTDRVMTLGSATALAGHSVGKTGPNSLHTGDSITVKFFPAKDGSPQGYLKSVTYSDGHVIATTSPSPKI